MTDQLTTADVAAGDVIEDRTVVSQPDAVCATCQCEKMRCPASVESSPSVLTVASLRRRLAEQNTVIRRLRAEKDRQLRTITGNLLLLESQLRREKDRVDTLLDEKNRKIDEQEKCIRALLRLNRKLAARAPHRKTDPSTATSSSSSSLCAEDIVVAGKRPRKKENRRISWHSEVSIYGEDGRRWNASCREPNTDDDDDGHILDRFPNIREVSDEDDEEDDIAEVAREVAGNSSTDTEDDDDDGNDEDSDLVRAADEACDAFGEALDGYVSETLSDDVQSRCHFSRLNMYRLDGPNVVGGAAAAGSTTLPPNQLGNFYNRVMSNHRSVTKPKDVKYKKISRVKSRSLEELRGRLKCYARPVTIGHSTTAAAAASPPGYYDNRGACSSAPS